MARAVPCLARIGERRLCGLSLKGSDTPEPFGDVVPTDESLAQLFSLAFESLIPVILRR